MKLKRDTIGGILGGVCAGISKNTKVDVTLIRVIWAICILCYGVGFLAYILFWILMPAE